MMALIANRVELACPGKEKRWDDGKCEIDFWRRQSYCLMTLAWSSGKINSFFLYLTSPYVKKKDEIKLKRSREE